MHEYPITQRIIEIATEHANSNNANKVKRINLVVGDNCGYVASSIDLYFDIIAEGTVCSGAELNIERVKSKLRCTSCGQMFERKLFSFECPDCGADGEPTEVGKEFYVRSIEIE